jgi:hypothetical protein
VTYSDIADMTNSVSLTNRVAAAAAGEGQADPWNWATSNAWAVAASPGWSEAWAYARDQATLDDNPDTGARPGVINDEMILAAVQDILAPQPEPEQPDA